MYAYVHPEYSEAMSEARLIPSYDVPPIYSRPLKDEQIQQSNTEPCVFVCMWVWGGYLTISEGIA